MLIHFLSLHWIFRRGATVHFSCDEGYELQGSKSISCLRVTDSYVGWSDDRPICRGNDWRVIADICILTRGDVDVFAFTSVVILSKCSISLHQFFILRVHYLSSYCDYPEFEQHSFASYYVIRPSTVLPISPFCDRQVDHSYSLYGVPDFPQFQY